MNQNEFEQLAELFKIFGTPTRLQILYALIDEEKCVYDIAQELGLSTATVKRAPKGALYIRQQYLYG